MLTNKFRKTHLLLVVIATMLMPVVSIADDNKSLRNKLVSEAQEWIGAPYSWGGNTRNGVDCSGLTVNIYKTIDITIPRNSREQKKFCREISEDELLPGDLIFGSKERGGIIDHVGIYIGNDKIIHAASKGVCIATLSTYDKDYIGFIHSYGRVPALDNKNARKATQAQKAKKSQKPSSESKAKSTDAGRATATEKWSYPLAFIAENSLESQGGNSYEPYNLMDRNKSTCWACPWDGNSQTLTFGWDSTTYVGKILVRNGYQKNAQTFSNNCRAKKVAVYVDNKYMKTVTMNDDMNPDAIIIKGNALEIKLVIKSVYPGNKYNDLCISEIGYTK